MRERTFPRSLFPCIALLAFAPACNRAGGAASPRISSIPLQTTPGGTTFTLDLSAYVTDDTKTATYAVTSGGGSFSGSTYSRTFPTLGTYTVGFKATDFRGNSTSGSFQVKVTSAEIALVRNGTGVSYYDVQTGNLTSVLQDDGRTKTHKASLTDGCSVFEVDVTGQKDLYLYDPNEQEVLTIAQDSSKSEVYLGKTSDGKILFQAGSSPARSLHLYDTTNGGLSKVTASTGGARDERDGIVNSADLVFFESAENGLADIYYFDIANNKTVAVSTHARDEDLVTALPDGAVLFRRKGDGGEWDLFYFKAGVGVVEVGADLDGSSPFTESKTYAGRTSDSRVVFSTTDGSDTDLYIWNPGTGQTSTIANSVANESLAGITATDLIVYKIQTGSSNADLSYYNPSTNGSTTVANSSDDETYDGSLSNGDIVFTRNTGGNGKDLYWFDVSAGSANVFSGANTTSTDYLFAKVLANDKIVYTVGASIYLYDTTGPTATSISTAAGTESFAGETGGGDFVISLSTGGQNDLYLWDESASAAVAITTNTGDEVFKKGTTHGPILFTRKDSGATTSDLYVWDPSSKKVTRITTNSVEDGVDTVFEATVSN